MRESKTVEFKETVDSNTFLKTVSAYANYGTGKIVFGIKDNGDIVGIDDPKQAVLNLENKINDSIDPNPDYTFEIDQKTSVITLTVKEGLHKPYFYKSKAYRRNDSATIEVDRLELSRLILEGTNQGYEDLPAIDQNLTFTILEEKLKEKMNIESLSKDVLKTLQLYDDQNGYNKAAELLADKNGFMGIDIARFGDDINTFLDRETFDNCSILKMYDEAVKVYRRVYQYEKIEGVSRNRYELIPEEAYRETIANALLHRTWDVKTHITVSMYDERIEVVSLGGLPKSLSEEEFFKGGVSVLRNPIIGNVMFRLQMIERFGTGIRRISESYKGSEKKPIFETRENSIRVTLPLFEEKTDLPEDEKLVYRLLKGKLMSSSEIASYSGFGKTKTVRILNGLVEKGYVRTEGTGRARKYTA